jgi:hypothetical protein
MEIHDLDEPDAFAILVELSNKNLLTLVNDAQYVSSAIYVLQNIQELVLS